MPETVQLDKVYDPREVEPRIYAEWEQAGAFAARPGELPTPREKTFVIVIPPPNVTGALHLGHALNNTLQDILIRYHRMRGFNTLWQPGTDHAGIATQAVVERRIRESEGLTRHQLGKTEQECRDELVRRIWQWKDEYEKRILNQLKQMGCSCDWSRNRFTFDEGLSKAVRHMFFRLFKDGLIFRGKRLVNWDTQLQTAVSDDEVYHDAVKGHFWHFRYPVIDPKPGEPEFVVIATTRPETMLGDTAVAVHPDPEGYFESIEKELKELQARLTQTAGSGSPRTTREWRDWEARRTAVAERRESHLVPLVRLRDMARDGRKVLLPLVEREIPLICDEWADPLLGSGCVKITPAHDPNDYDVGLRHNLPMINVMTADGKIAEIKEPAGSLVHRGDGTRIPFPNGGTNPFNAEFAGLEFSTGGRAKVVSAMESRGLLHEIEDRDIDLAHSERSKTPIEPYLSDQWFVRTSEPPTSVGADARTAEESQRVEDNRRTEDSLMPDGPKAIVVPSKRSPDLGAGAVLITWTMYGTWLPGDERGFVSRVPSEERPHPVHSAPGEKYDADDPQALGSAIGRLQGHPVYLSAEQAHTVLMAAAGVCGRHAIEPLAVAVMSNHIHLLCQTERPKDELLKLFKGSVSRALSAQFDLQNAPRWFTKGGSVRYSKSRKDLTAAIEYVKEQEHPLASWSFDEGREDFDAAFQEAIQKSAGNSDMRTSAPTEVGGSLGLAQAAMDVVQDGRIKVFPSRYAKSYLDWLGEKRDWCISRQLWWGHRIAVWTIRPSSYLLNEPSLRPPGKGDEQVRALFRLLCSAIDKLFEALGERDNYTCSFDYSSPTCVYVCTRSQRADDIFAAFRDFNDIGLREWMPGTPRHITPSTLPGFDAGTPEAIELGKLILNSPDGVYRDPDVLDTWFSSALWPFSTLGWPEETKELKQYYPTTVLCTSRDIITNWVARMVMFGLYALGEVPFDHVYIHPKILDGRGETMSKSKGNGVDPVDIIHTHGADALRYSMADMTTETQDIRMPIEYICPHCGKLTEQQAALKADEQRRKSRGERLDRKLQPSDCRRVQCTHPECGREFATQWAEPAVKQELGLGRETSEKFDIGRNFCNKLWNAARFAFMNLEGATCAPLEIAGLPPEDRWILAKLSETIRNFHAAVQQYQFSASVKVLREFFWDCLCDWYIELTKPRMNGERGDRERATAQQVLAFCLDQVLRLWHPTIPFITERLWQSLNEIVPRRGLPGVADLKTDGLLINAEFPPLDGYPALDDPTIVRAFADLQDATRGVRDVRAASGVSPKERVTVTIVAPADRLHAVDANAHILRHMAGIGELSVASSGQRPPNAGSVTVGHLRIYVHNISDDAAERQRSLKQLEQVVRQIAGKESKLNHEKFVANADPEVVEAERRRLAELVAQRATLEAHLAELSG